MTIWIPSRTHDLTVRSINGACLCRLLAVDVEILVYDEESNEADSIVLSDQEELITLLQLAGARGLKEINGDGTWIRRFEDLRSGAAYRYMTRKYSYGGSLYSTSTAFDGPVTNIPGAWDRKVICLVSSLALAELLVTSAIHCVSPKL
jgi:hypothetical protein